jgi:hypothetical protein
VRFANFALFFHNPVFCTTCLIQLILQKLLKYFLGRNGTIKVARVICTRPQTTGCLKIREFRIQSVVGDHFSNPNIEKKKKKKTGLPPQKYIGLKVHSLKGVFFKYRQKSSVFIVIYGVDDCGK